MGERQAGRARGPAHSDGVFNGAVPPSDLVLVFVECELGIVDDQIGTAQKLTMRAMLPQYFALA